MKYSVMFLFWICAIVIGYTQHKPYKTFRDYLFHASHPDSLQKVEKYTLPNPHSLQYLQLLICVELGKQNWNDTLNKAKTKQIIRLASKQKSQIGLATTYFILGRHYSYEKEDSLSYHYLTKAAKIFTENKDTTGLLFCYRQLRLSVHENYQDLAKQYFNQLITLSTQSKNPIDKYSYYLSVMSADPYFEKQPTEPQLLDAFNKAIEMIDAYPYCEFMRRNIYHNLQQGYVYLNKYNKVLDIALQTIQHPKIKADYMDYQNLGRTYIRVKKFDDAIVALERASKEIKTGAPTNFRRQRNIYKLLKIAYYNAGKWKEGVKADEEYDRLNEIIFESDRSLAMFHLKEKYSFTEKEAELKRLALEKQVAESRNKLLKAQYDAQKREATLSNLSLEKQATESNAKLLRTQMEIQRKEGVIKLADSQRKQLLSGLLIALVLVGIVAYFSVRLQKTNTQLLQLQEARDKLYTLISHDLRSSVNSFSEAGLLLRYFLKQNKKEEVEKVTFQLETMAYQANLLLNNLFEWGKHNYLTHTLPARFERIEAVELLQNLSEYYLPFAEVKGISLVTVLPASLTLYADPKELEMVVRNLLDNALKHTPCGGTVTLSCCRVGEKETGSKSSVTVADTGAGIAPQQLMYLRQVFAGKIKPEVGVNGLGLGMVLIYRFVQKHKATLILESELGRGTTIAIQM